MSDLDEKLSRMMSKAKIDERLTIDPDQDLSVDKNIEEKKVEEEKKPVSSELKLLAEFFKQETKNGNFFDHDENKLRKQVQRLLIENKLVEEHECARR